MFCPPGYLNFEDIAFMAKDFADEICLKCRLKDLSNGYVLSETNPIERDAVYCWLIGNFFRTVDALVCAPSGTVLRAPNFLFEHFDLLDWGPPPLPIEESSLIYPNLDSVLSLSKLYFFSERFKFIDVQLGIVSVKTKNLSEINVLNQFSEQMVKELNDRYSRQVAALAPYYGMSICVKELGEPDLGEDVSDKVLAQLFGLSDDVIQKLNKLALYPYPLSYEDDSRSRRRKRDEAEQIYWSIYPEGHEAAGDVMKTVQFKLSEALGKSVSVDTILRFLGKKK